jgi:arylsulfatase
MNQEISRKQFITAGTTGLCGILLSGCAPGFFAGGSKKRYNIVFISIDTLRADHLGCYGYHRDTSPNIDEFARDNIFFENFFTCVPKTNPSMTSFFTGQYIQNHGVIGNKLHRSKSVIGLVELIPDHYKKAAFVANPNLTRTFGFRGFDAWNHILTTQDKLTGQAIEYLDETQGNDKFFLWLHYIDPHGPYTPPEKFDGFVGDEFYDPSRKVNLDYLSYDGYNDNYVIFGQVAVPKRIREGDIDEVDYYIARYDAEIRYSDHEVGRILEYLESKGLMNDSIVIFTADHGESLGENDYYFDHGKLVNAGSIRIPLIIKHPAIEAPLKIDSLLQNTDLAPTLLSEFGLEFPCEIDGVDFSELYRDSRLRRRGIIDKELRPYVYSCTPNGYPRFYETIRTKKGKLIRDFAVRQVGNDFGKYAERVDDEDNYSFYDVSRGKLDTHDIISSIPEKGIEDYCERIENFGLAGNVAGRKIRKDELDAKTKDRLRTLGYI